MRRVAVLVGILLGLSGIASATVVPDTYSPNYRLVIPSTGSTGWGLKLNTDIIQIDTTIASIPLRVVTPSNGTLGAGATFYSFTAEANIHLTTMSVVLNNSGEGAGTTVWRCGGSSYLSESTTDSTDIGIAQTATGNISFTTGQTIACMIYSSTQAITPTGAIELVYAKN